MALATTALLSIKEYDDDCGGRSELVVMRKDGQVTPVNTLDISQGEHVTMGFAKASNNLLLAISKPDVTDEQVTEQLVTFSQAIKTIVKEGRSGRQLLELIEGLKSRIYG